MNTAALTLQALGRSLAMIVFRPDGTIIEANENFLSLMGYRLEEVAGAHHSVFVDPDERRSEEYAAFWRALAAGEHRSARFRRISKSGERV